MRYLYATLLAAVVATLAACNLLLVASAFPYPGPYSVTYNGNAANAGTAPTDGSGHYKGQTVIVLANTGNLEKTGYGFAGWNTQTNGFGTRYIQGQTITIGLSNVTLYALWLVPTISTVAGNGTAGYTGDGGSAVAAELHSPWGLAADTAGDLFIGDTANNCVRKVNTLGTITTVAGNGTAGYSGDGGPATAAQLSSPRGVAIDASGNLYIGDTANNCVRKVNTFGTITTVAGNGTAGYSGDGGPATAAQLNAPHGIAIDSSGNLVIADQTNECVRKVNATTGTITTVAGNGTAGYSGNGGPATAAQLHTPAAVAVDSSGNTYIADQANDGVRRVDATTGIITTVAGNGTAGYSGDGGPATAAQLSSPRGVATDASGNLYIGDAANNCVRKVDTFGTITTVAGNGIAGYSGDGGPATAAQLSSPRGVVLDSLGYNLYVADYTNNRIRKVSPP
jgi:hypothetical protein